MRLRQVQGEVLRQAQHEGLTLSLSKGEAAAGEVFAAFPRWRLWDDREGGGAAERIGREAALAEAVARGASPPTFRLWEGAQALVVTRRQTRLPRFREAAAALAADGWPVIVRASGGEAVPHGAGILHLTLVLPRCDDAAAVSVETLYRALCAPLLAALSDLGIEAGFGEIPGAFCDGRFDLVAEGRKLAGTAQRWAGGPAGAGARRGYALAHALLLVEPDLAAATAALNRFYALAGAARRVDAAACTTVRQCLGGAGPDGLTEAVRSRIAAAVTASAPGLPAAVAGRTFSHG